MVRRKSGEIQRMASFCLEHSMVFEMNELLEKTVDEYRFSARDGKEYYFTASDVKILT